MPSYSSSEVGVVLTLAKERKRVKYLYLDPCYLLSQWPMRLQESLALRLVFLSELGHGLRQVPGEVQLLLSPPAYTERECCVSCTNYGSCNGLRGFLLTCLSEDKNWQGRNEQN